jgi:hypothetical protein
VGRKFRADRKAYGGSPSSQLSSDSSYYNTHHCERSAARRCLRLRSGAERERAARAVRRRAALAAAAREQPSAAPVRRSRCATPPGGSFRRKFPRWKVPLDVSGGSFRGIFRRKFPRWASVHRPAARDAHGPTSHRAMRHGLSAARRAPQRHWATAMGWVYDYCSCGACVADGRARADDRARAALGDGARRQAAGAQPARQSATNHARSHPAGAQEDARMHASAPLRHGVRPFT